SIAIILLVVGYFVNSCVQEERKETKARLEEEVKEQKVRDAVLGLQKRTGASAAWVDSLEGERHRRRDPVLTVELEKLWLTGNPIIFVGEIADVVRSSDSQYLVTI